MDISRLKSIGDLQDTKGVKAGVSSVDYIYEGDKTDGVSNNLITQINYTLTQDSLRGKDIYNLYYLKLAPDEAYSLNALETVKQPENELLDMAKLKVFSEGVRSRLVLLREDFNMIKKMFFEGLIPVNMGKVEITNTIPDPLQQLLGAKDYHQVIYKEVGAVQKYVDRDGVLRGVASSLQNTIDELKQQSTQIQAAEQGQLRTQQQIQASQLTQQQLTQQLEVTKQQLAETQKKLSGK